MKSAAEMSLLILALKTQKKSLLKQSSFGKVSEQIIKRRKLNQEAAAKAMGINQPKVSALQKRRKLDGFSVECLIHFLNALGQDIDIVVRPKPRSRKQAKINVYHEVNSGG